MASVDCELNIELTPDPGDNLCGWLKTDDQGLRPEISSLGYEWTPMGRGEYHMCKICEPEGSESIEKVRQLILQAGFSECHTTVIPKTLRRTHFAFRHMRKFTKKDLDLAEYLRLNVKGSQRIADRKEKTETGFVLKANGRLKNKLDFGWLDVIIIPYVSEKGRAELEGKNFEGIEFEPAIFDQPEKVAKQLYQLTSNLTMPPCLVPIKNSDGEVVKDESKEVALGWDDAGYVQPVLKYRREEVEAMGAFDIAKTREQTGNLPQHYRHQYIVSQRFRQQLEAMKVRSVDFVPVELVDDESEPIAKSHT